MDLYSFNPNMELGNLEKFEPLKVIGRGQFGEVFLAKHIVNKKYYAIKAIDKKFIVNEKQEYKILNELYINKIIRDSPIKCDFIGKLLHHFQNKTHLFFIFEFFSGGELFSYIREKYLFDENHTKFYIAEIILAVRHLHLLGIIYRDLKPENICVDADGHLHLIDFGLSTDGNCCGVPGIPIDTNNGCSLISGTPMYMAPEIFLKNEYGFSSDWWSLGILLYEMLHGYQPWYDEDYCILRKNILHGILHVDADLSNHAKNLLMALLCRDPTKRLGGNPKKTIDENHLDIMNHPFFNGIDWVLLNECKLETPYIPPMSFDDPTINFDKQFTNSELKCIKEINHECNFENTFDEFN
jgi:serine/threonine protein kinase